MSLYSHYNIDFLSSSSCDLFAAGGHGLDYSAKAEYRGDKIVVTTSTYSYVSQHAGKWIKHSGKKTGKWTFKAKSNHLVLIKTPNGRTSVTLVCVEESPERGFVRNPYWN